MQTIAANPRIATIIVTLSIEDDWETHDTIIFTRSIPYCKKLVAYNVQKRHLTQYPTDPEPSSHLRKFQGQDTYVASLAPRRPLGLSGWLIILLALPLLALLVYALQANFKARAVSAAQPEGRSVSSVATNLNTQTMPLLIAARHKNPNPARGGGDISVVDGSALAATGGPSGSNSHVQAKPNDPGAISLYIVREGDSLSQIAEMFDVSVNTIRWANDISRSESIQPGQTLVILPISGVQHEVEKGDTLKSLAEDYEADINEIIEFNGLTTDSKLAVGETITIPGGTIVIPEAPASSSGSSYIAPSGGSYVNASGYFTHPLPGGQKTQGIHGYNGVDIAAPYGTAIVAAASGKVIVSSSGGWGMGYGNYIVIDHPNGTQTLYAHMSSNAVWQGANVVAGQVIGYVGSTGRSTGNHLHVEVRGAANPF